MASGLRPSIMQGMTRSKYVPVLFAILFISGCSPALNWRQLNVFAEQVQLLMPCKPDQASREVSLRVNNQDVPVNLQIQGCEASGMQFTVGQMPLPDGMPAMDAITAWRLASLAPLQLVDAKPTQIIWQLPGALDVPSPSRTHVMSSKHQAQFVWFAHKNNVYQAAVYGNKQDKGLPDAAETYFSGVRLP